MTRAPKGGISEPAVVAWADADGPRRAAANLLQLQPLSTRALWLHDWIARQDAKHMDSAPVGAPNQPEEWANTASATPSQDALASSATSPSRA